MPFDLDDDEYRATRILTGADKPKKEVKMRKFFKVKRVEGVDFKLPQRSTKHSARFRFLCTRESRNTTNES